MLNTTFRAIGDDAAVLLSKVVKKTIGEDRSFDEKHDTLYIKGVYELSTPEMKAFVVDQGARNGWFSKDATDTVMQRSFSRFLCSNNSTDGAKVKR